MMDEIIIEKPKYSQLRKTFINFIKWYNQNSHSCKDVRKEIKQLHRIYAENKNEMNFNAFFTLKQLQITTIVDSTWLQYKKVEKNYQIQYLIQLILNYIPKKTIAKFKPSLSGLLFVEFPDLFSELTILENNTWDEIKRNIDQKLTFFGKTNETCPLCMEECVCLVTCNKCTHFTCDTCYIDIIRTNKGIHKCPFCRNEIGRVIEEDLADFCKSIEKRVKQNYFIRNQLMNEKKNSFFKI